MVSIGGLSAESVPGLAHILSPNHVVSGISGAVHVVVAEKEIRRTQRIRNDGAIRHAFESRPAAAAGSAGVVSRYLADAFRLVDTRNSHALSCPFKSVPVFW